MRKLILMISSLILGIFIIACNDKWDDHYNERDIELDSNIAKVVDTDVESYIKSDSEFSQISQLFEEYGIYKQIESKNQEFTVLVYSNNALIGANIEDPEFFAKTSICDLNLAPAKITNGLSLLMWNNKYLEVTLKNTTVTDVDIFIADSKVKSITKTNNAYVYELESPIYAPKSLYEVLEQLGEDYSLFQELVKSYEEQVFDRDNSTPIGVDATGNMTYDSLFDTKNLLMDRYDSGGALTWNMRSEYYNSTMLIPSNTIVEQTLQKAYDDFEAALGYVPTANDTTKFKEWIIEACFYSSVLTPEQLEGEDDITGVSGYQEGASASTSGAQWKPTVQKVDTENPILLSNGIAYYITELKIPNNVLIYRIKQRFYTYRYCDPEEKQEYFTLTNLEEPTISENGGMGPLGPWPYIAYDLLRAKPTAKAYEDLDTVAIECTGISYENGIVSVAMIPPGEYNLRMGFREKQSWRASIYFNGELVATNVDPGSCHYDRSGTGYPEGYVPAEWTSYDSKAANYDRDGMEIAVVVIEGDELQPIKIKVESTDMTSLGTSVSASVGYINLYHWCLRPTSNNY
ncbi:MAG: hypothetical protein LIO65_08290 [Odoribacter sp.]|nr:hypothetical protein [Odoribacter sp.]